MKCNFRYTIKYSEVDASRHLRLSDLECYLLESAGLAADQLGFGTNWLKDKYNCTWVLTRMSVEMEYLPIHGDQIHIETWVEQNIHMFSIRNYRVYLVKDEDEFLIGQATSIWTTLNLTTREVNQVYDDPIFEGKIAGEKVDLARAPRLGLIAESTSTMRHQIHYSDLDFNNHCNSIKYLQFLLNACDELTGQYPVRLDINYAKEVVKGEQVTIDVDLHKEEKMVNYCLRTEAGDISCTARIALTGSKE